MARIDDRQMMVRCWENGIRLYPKPFDNNKKMNIELEYQGQYKLGTTEFDRTQAGKLAIAKKMEELYVDLYFRYKHKFIRDKVWDFGKKMYI